MRKLLLTTLAALFAIYASAQACLPTEITLSSYMNINGPSWYAWDIMGVNNQMFASGIAQFTPQMPNYPASACLPPGCYTLTAVAMTVIQPGSTFASFDPAGGYWSDYDVSYDGMAMTMVFCIAENQPCEIEVAVLEEQTCSTFNLVATTPNDAAQIYWSINGEPYTSGGFFSWEASNPGAYQICAAFETPDCPEGVFWCETFVVSPECLENDCPYDFVITQQDCWSVFYLSGANDGDVVYYVDGEPVSNGELAYTHWFGSNGSFEVCAVYEGICDQTEFCETIEISNCQNNNTCELDVSIIQLDCSPVLLTASNFAEGAQIQWFVNNDYVESGPAFDFSPETAGNYQICAQYETPNCAESVSWCETFSWQPACFEECNYDLFVDLDGCIGVFLLDGGVQGSVDFYVDGVLVNNQENAFTYIFPENGSYNVCAVYEGICDQTEFCETVVVTDCSDVNPCSVDFEVLPPMNCGAYVIFPVNDPVGAIVLVEVNGVVIGQGVNEVLFVPPSSGAYEVCVYAQAGQCGELVSQCETVQMTACADDCGMVLSVNQFNCGGFAFDVQVLSGWQNINWTINGEPYGLQTWNQNIQFTEEGIYEICATYENAQCGFQQVCTTVTVENCVQGCTEFSLSLFSQVNQNGPTYVLYGITDAEENAVDAGEVFFNNDTFMQVLDFCLPAGCYTIALTAPNGGLTGPFDWLFQGALNQYTYDLVEFTDQMMVFEVCLEPTLVWDEVENCELYVQLSLNNDGYFVFESDSPDGANVNWLVNGEEAGSGNGFVLNDAEPGVYEVCAYYFASFCVNGAVYCTTVVVPDLEGDSCTEVTIEIANNSGFPNDILVNALLESLELEFDFDVTLYELSFAAGIGMCLPDGCYDFTLDWEAFALANLFVTVGIDGDVVLNENIDVINQTVTIQLAVNADCSVGVAEVGQPGELNLFPHPADQAVNLTHTFTGAVNVQIFDLNGRMVAAFDQLVGNTLQLPTAALSQGLYIVQVSDGNYVKQAKMQIQR